MWSFFKRKRKTERSDAKVAHESPATWSPQFTWTKRPEVHPSVRLESHLKLLSKHYPLWIDDDYRFVIVGRIRLPRGYDCREANLLIELPSDYPVTPPGVGDHRVYVWPQLQFHGRALRDQHPETTPGFHTPGFGPWAWWCYQTIRWIPSRDDLVRFVEMVRADMINPCT